MEEKKNEIVEIEIAVQNKVVEDTGDAPDGSNPLAMTTAIAESLLADDIETTMDLLLALQKMHAEDEGVSV